MPARVHAFLVVRPEGRTTAALHLKRTLAALEAQTRKPDTLTIVMCGGDKAVADVAGSSRAEGVITAAASTSYAHALSLATSRLTGEAVWLLAQDTAPEPEALARLAGALELSPSISVAAPKLVDGENRQQIVSLGVSMTRYGRTVEIVEDELDQGQHDVKADAMAADVRGLLVRADAWRQLGGLDPALAGADEGLDLGVRARLAGGRVELVPRAIVAVDGDGVAGLPLPQGGKRIRRRVFAVRTAQLHRRLVYAPAASVALHWLSLLPLALWRTILKLLAKEPASVVPEWAAAILALVRWRAISRARAGIRRTRRSSWALIAPLRVGRETLRERLDIDPDETGEAPRRSDLALFSGGGAWVVLAALLLSAAVFPALLAWPVLGGGAIAPLRETLAGLWTDAGYGIRSTGLNIVAAADPFAAVVAVLGSLWPGDPSRAVVFLWLLALPLAVLGGWFAVTRITERSLLRITAGVAWALAPTFWSALIDGRPTGVIVHLLLPWLFYAGSVVHRSWTAAGAASLLMAATIASAPSLGPALVVLWLGAIILTIIMRAGRGAGRIVWTMVPTAVLFAPLVWTQLRLQNPWGLLADPGVVWAGPTASADSTGRALLAAGFPSGDFGGWTSILQDLAPGVPVWSVVFLTVPIVVLALLAPLTPRWLPGMVLVVFAALGIGTAILQVGIAVSFDNADAVAIWPGTGLSLAWMGIVGAAVVTLEAGLVPRQNVARAVSATVVMTTLAVLAIPALTAVNREQSALTNGPTSTLPAYVAAQGRDDASVGTIVLTPLEDGSVVAEIIWGGSETIGGQSTAINTRVTATASDDETAALTSALVTATSSDAVSQLASEGIGFVLLAPSPGSETDEARTIRLSAQTALNQRENLDAVGDTEKGLLWRVTDDVAPRAEASIFVRETGRLIAIVQLLIFGAAVLLAVPTSASRRAARRTSRIVGPHAQEVR
ncbi:GT2 family glycosyltransferase [Microbacterium endophyticum]|uniref:GT2 family glycosyltransferase n=1 Tax=Microbacterium endophyticum TaxID=1526412 RepID=A0A7W4V502_9MICO|nr:glycosyltransferase [Microbacterium endophyticum]MBB2976323.1 GT2 family glycosyltransferase [Microbacterium endophyticum]NIK35203.1 GT2 family glycosyltransferase [Microbacterium endophyticum]